VAANGTTFGILAKILGAGTLAAEGGERKEKMCNDGSNEK
jgi:hypothetical protein